MKKNHKKTHKQTNIKNPLQKLQRIADLAYIFLPVTIFKGKSRVLYFSKSLTYVSQRFA